MSERYYRLEGNMSDRGKILLFGSIGIGLIFVSIISYFIDYSLVVKYFVDGFWSISVIALLLMFLVWYNKTFKDDMLLKIKNLLLIVLIAGVVAVLTRYMILQPKAILNLGGGVADFLFWMSILIDAPAALFLSLIATISES